MNEKLMVKIGWRETIKDREIREIISSVCSTIQFSIDHGLVKNDGSTFSGTKLNKIYVLSLGINIGNIINLYIPKSYNLRLFTTRVNIHSLTNASLRRTSNIMAKRSCILFTHNDEQMIHKPQA